MSVKYNEQFVDEKYSSILEPNLYYGSVFVPGVTFTDKYQIGPAGGIYVHKLSTTACEVGTPGRDFTDEETKDTLIQIVMNNNYQKSKKIYGVQAAACGIALANENLAAAISVWIIKHRCLPQAHKLKYGGWNNGKSIHRRWIRGIDRRTDCGITGNPSTGHGNAYRSRCTARYRPYPAVSGRVIHCKNDCRNPQCRKADFRRNEWG